MADLIEQTAVKIKKRLVERYCARVMVPAWKYNSFKHNPIVSGPVKL